ncbi:MAG: hypothetical protein BA871_12235 [Desulfuromonadales bacterium C00003096]|nr:MAG: hypothetical protein BA871_12235 [Desulfuromonadales bacterium C00003096]OEU72789.1 MAG: hypothetical protein BA869_07020 [Desulfuromonadales bacterium C00003107]
MNKSTDNSKKHPRQLLMHSQKLTGWLNKNFGLQCLVFFQKFQTYIEYVEVLKKRRNAIGLTFCDAINR